MRGLIAWVVLVGVLVGLCLAARRSYGAVGGVVTTGPGVAFSSVERDAEANAYCDARNITDSQSRVNVSGYVRAMKLAGVWTVLGDCCLLRTNYQNVALANVKTWKGLGCTVYGSPVMSAAGLSCALGGADGLWFPNLPDMRVNSVWVEANYSIDNVAGSYTFFSFVGGDGTIANFWGLDAMLFRQTGGDLLNVLQVDNSSQNNPIPFYDYKGSTAQANDALQVYTAQMNGTVATLYIDGIGAGTAANVAQSATAAIAMTTPLRNVMVGGAAVGGTELSSKSTVAFWAIFTRPLTATEVAAVNAAIRWLDPQEESVLFFGTSREVPGSQGGGSFDARQIWPWQLMQTTGEKYRWYNRGISGARANLWVPGSANWNTYVVPLLPDGSKVKRATAFVDFGANDIFHINGVTALSAWMDTSNILAGLRQANCKVIAIPEIVLTNAAQVNDFSSAQIGPMLYGFNQCIITNPWCYDGLIRRDLAISSSDMNDGTLTPDNLHLSAKGNTNFTFRAARDWAGTSVLNGGLNPADDKGNLQVYGVLSGTNALGTDKAAKALTLAGGQSTGTGRGGAIIEQTTPSGATGPYPNGYVTRRYVSPKEVTVTKSSATLVFNISLASGKSMGARVYATTRCDNATDFQAITDSFVFGAVNKAGTIPAITISTVTSANNVSTGTITDTWTAVVNGNGIDVKCNAVPSLTPGTLTTEWRVEIDTNDTGLTVTPQ